jgi:hypothetical protein
VSIADHDVLDRAPAVNQNANLTSCLAADFGQPAGEVVSQ